jgi:hypothetical protein
MNDLKGGNGWDCDWSTGRDSTVHDVSIAATATAAPIASVRSVSDGAFHGLTGVLRRTPHSSSLPRDLRWPAHRDFVIGRVLQSGGMAASEWLRETVPDVALADWIGKRNGRGLDPRQLRFWQLALNLPAADVDRWVTLASERAWARRTRA